MRAWYLKMCDFLACRLLFLSSISVIPEMWVEGQDRAQGIQEQGIIEPPSELGVLAGQYWWVPRFTAERYPELLNYVGLSGEEKREKVSYIPLPFS